MNCEVGGLCYLCVLLGKPGWSSSLWKKFFNWQKDVTYISITCGRPSGFQERNYEPIKLYQTHWSKNCLILLYITGCAQDILWVAVAQQRKTLILQASHTTTISGQQLFQGKVILRYLGRKKSVLQGLLFQMLITYTWAQRRNFCPPVLPKTNADV